MRDIMMESGLIEEANVYGVQVPNNLNGRAGMAAMVLTPEHKKREAAALIDLGRALQKALPHYAVPRFMRVLETMDSAQTVTFKHRKVELQKEGFDPKTISENLYFFVENKGYVPLTPELYDQITAGKAKL